MATRLLEAQKHMHERHQVPAEVSGDAHEPFAALEVEAKVHIAKAQLARSLHTWRKPANVRVHFNKPPKEAHTARKKRAARASATCCFDRHRDASSSQTASKRVSEARSRLRRGGTDIP